MKKFQYLILFLVINFSGLALGVLLMDNGPTSDWYISLNKAPWTPPGWLFGIAWSTIMVCFSWYLVELFILRASKYLWMIYIFQVILNVGWNYLFFNQHLTTIGFGVIIILTLVILYFFFTFRRDRLKYAKYLLLPYIIWMCIATSLNAYIVLNN